MALQAVVYQQAGLLGVNDGNKDVYSLLENWSWDFNLLRGDQLQELEENRAGYLRDVVDNQPESYRYSDHDHDHNPWELEISPLSSMVPSFSHGWGPTPTPNSSDQPDPPPMETPDQLTTRPKRRRVARSRKNKEDIENQRMTHIAVERNRRNKMNQYLSVLKSLMPVSYVQRGDQASIVGATINFVKELEHHLHCLSTQKTRMNNNSQGKCSSLSPFEEFLSFPQHSTRTDTGEGDEGTTSTIADVEVSMAEGHASVKIRSRKHPKQLIKMVTGLHNLRLTILHLNVSTVDQFALYSFSVKVEDDSKLTSVDEVAAAVHQLLVGIHEEVHMSS